MKTHTLYTREDCGCFADGGLGKWHVNGKANRLAYAAGWRPQVTPDTMESDLAEEAIYYLNANCVEPGLSFIFDNGDLLLVEDESESSYFDGSGR